MKEIKIVLPDEELADKEYKTFRQYLKESLFQHLSKINDKGIRLDMCKTIDEIRTISHTKNRDKCNEEISVCSGDI